MSFGAEAERRSGARFKTQSRAFGHKAFFRFCGRGIAPVQLQLALPRPPWRWRRARLLPLPPIGAWASALASGSLGL
eukprot:scaffold12993_cov96-Isochrysis_galbana.AAC.3